MEETVQMFNEVFASLDSVLLLCIAGFIALAFIGYLIYDSVRRKRNKQRFGRTRSGNPITSSYRSVRSGYRSLMEEMDRRRRRLDRERSRRR